MPSTKDQQIDENTSDKDLVHLLKNGNELALNTIMGRYKNRLYSFINYYIRDEDIAYDILQETFIKVHLKSDTYNANYKFSTWLYQIATNLCHDWSRKQKIRQWVSLDNPLNEEGNYSFLDLVIDTTSDTEDIISTKHDLLTLNKEIQKLPHKLKTALILFTMEGNSQEECAALLGVTSKTIETRVYRARKILIKKLPKLSKDYSN